MTGAFLLAVVSSTYKMYYVNYTLGISVDNSVLHVWLKSSASPAERTLALISRTANHLEEL